MTIDVRGEISDLLVFGRDAPDGDINAGDVDDQLTLNSGLSLLAHIAREHLRRT